VADPERWHGRLRELIDVHLVPGAALAFWYEGAIHEFAAGVLNLDTGVEATPDSLFQIGSVTKVWTATQVMLLAEEGRLTPDTPVVDVLPEFRLADAAVTRSVTVRHLLSHTSGIDGDLFLDTGRGDDCLERYLAACSTLGQIHPLGATQSYCNAGFVVLGRIVERLTGKVWDQALRDQIIEPLGLTRTVTLPEDALPFRTATGHVGGTGGDPLRPTPVWGLMRAIGPAGLICASAGDVVEFGRAHLSDGPLGVRSRVAMQEPQVEVPNPHSLGTHWGLGWILDSWQGRRVLLHGGNTIGQSAAFWVVPDAGVVVCLLANGGHDAALQEAVATELFDELCGLTARTALRPPPEPPSVDVEQYVGVYQRTGMRIVLSVRTGRPHARVENTGPYADLAPPLDIPLVPVDDVTFVGRPEGDPQWISMVFFELSDGSPYVHFSARATPRVA
jgi:CubicO group peptidase (beta-lactamase class C family)